MVSPSRRLAAGSKRRGLFAPIVSGQASFGHLGHQIGSRKTAGALSRVTVRLSPPLASPRAASRVIRHVVARSGVLFHEGSFEGPSNTQMEPTRPTVLCDPVTAARGSFATFGGLRQD